MSSAYAVNYHLRAHKRDTFIEFIKSLLLNPFVLHTRIKDPDHSAWSPLGPPGTIQALQAAQTTQTTQTGSGLDRDLDRYCEVLECIEELIVDHIHNHEQGHPELSRLVQLVPSIGRFYTPLPLKTAFLKVNKARAIAARRNVPPSFNDIRYILNSAQVLAIHPALRLVTFDGDMTLYADGADFERDSQLVGLIIDLLKHGLHVAVVTAAGYPGNAARYEKRLSGLLEGMRGSNLGSVCLERFYVLGGECNYLFQYNAASGSLVYIPEESYQSEAVKCWSNATDRITDLLNIAQANLESYRTELGLTDDRAFIVRKPRALGLCAAPGVKLTREVLDECALGVQKTLNNYLYLGKLKAAARGDASWVSIPFCAFNGGNDMWVDIGNKLIGVQILQQYLGTHGHETLHLGDQFLSTGNDIATRSACCTIWITSPEETAEVLNDLRDLLESRA
ncbi:IMP-specific 5-nucleotidase [Polychytrium aggregatum]|uniref:IMP-specific 5-nucleotidase n=1 Tax=Polychytrium aggregatum TaxID=110093 RepID=UPI0022FE9640|nr:IMP-specific 5-nucleotidase [Polychytrium aggregatum]KAI9207678.1 IMP-specific 5-nucleotidase [Polychytrium aggregatum]